MNKQITMPPTNQRFLDWYKDHFDSVFIALHPFFTIDGIDPATDSAGVSIQNSSGLPLRVLDTEILNSPVDAVSTQKSPDDDALVRAREKDRGKEVRWDSVSNGCKFGTCQEVFRSILVMTGAVAASNTDDADRASRLQSYCAKGKIFLPTGHTFSPSLENSLALLIRRLRAESLQMTDEFDEGSQTVAPFVLQMQLTWAALAPKASKIYPEDHSFLIAVPASSFNTVICGQRESLMKAGIEDLEGFWCDENTRPMWWLTEAETSEIEKRILSLQ